MFATKGDGVIYVSQCLKEHGFELADQLIHPERLTSTGYRAYMATIAQCIGLKDHQIQWLCTHLGHTEDIHKTHYRFTLEGIERIQLGKLLLMQDKILHTQFKDVDLKDIEFNDIISSIDAQKNVEVDDVEINDEIFQGNADSNEFDMTTDIMLDSVNPEKNKSKKEVKRTRWTEKEMTEINEYAEQWLRRKKTPSRKECLEMIKLSRKNGGELCKRTPDLIVKKISAINVKSRNALND